MFTQLRSFGTCVLITFAIFPVAGQSVPSHLFVSTTFAVFLIAGQSLPSDGSKGTHETPFKRTASDSTATLGGRGQAASKPASSTEPGLQATAGSSETVSAEAQKHAEL